ncbi:replication initiation protein [Enterococcus gallinarum]|uniref:replication initiation protein n=2 Tax=Enterococcus gallinarum TaxID=1353 RepID=UPI0032E41D6C
MTTWKENEFLFYSNALNDNYLMKNLKPAEMNLFMSLLTKISRNAGSITEPLTADFSMELDLQEIGGKSSCERLTNRSRETLETLQRVQSCLVSCSGSFLNGSKLITAPLFTKLSTDVDSGVLEVLINKELVNEYLKVDTAEGGKGEFTVINLLKFIGLKKKASKALYCLLSQYQGFGLVKLTVEDWKKALFVPKNTVNSRFFERYMSPAIEELKASGLFTNLKLTKNSKRGAKGITSCQINYKKVGAKQLVHDMLEEKTATQSAPREAIQPTIPVEEPKEPQKAPLTTVEASAYALDAFGTPITKSEYEALSKDLKQLCLILEGV